MIKAFLSVLLLFTVAATAKPQTSGPGLTAEAAPGTVVGPSTGAFFALSVADVRVLSRWYKDKLGFRILSEGEAPNKIARFAILEGDGALIEMIQHREAKSLSAAAPGIKSAFQVYGIFKIGMVVKNIDGVYQEVRKRGIPIAYELMRARDVSMRSFSIRDAEGNMIQFFGN